MCLRPWMPPSPRCLDRSTYGDWRYGWTRIVLNASHHGNIKITCDDFTDESLLCDIHLQPT